MVLPTYNEAKNIYGILKHVLAHGIVDVLVVHDNSTDGTRGIVGSIMGEHPNVSMLERPAKLGLGTAYTTGFRWGLERGYDCMMEMDSDFSHDPVIMPSFVEAIKAGAHLVIGSRYIGGTISVIGWDFKRLLLSRFGNIYAATILRMPLTDLTSGFRAYTRQALEGIDLDSICSQGYSFQIEMAYYVWCQGLRVREIPIVFTERAQGSSKMSKSIVREAVKLPWRLRLRTMLGRMSCRPSPEAEKEGR